MNRTIKITAVLILLLMVSSTLSATDYPKVGDKKATSNLFMALNSDNDGLRRSAIYFAGKYEVIETKDNLLKLFPKETNPNTRLLIAHALYNINDEQSMEKVYKMISNDPDPKVKRIGTAIYETYKLENAMSEEFVAQVE